MEAGDFVAADRARRVDQLLPRDSGLSGQSRVLGQISRIQRFFLAGTLPTVIWNKRLVKKNRHSLPSSGRNHQKKNPEITGGVDGGSGVLGQGRCHGRKQFVFTFDRLKVTHSGQ